MTDNNLSKQAKEIIDSAGYIADITKDETTDGEVIYFVKITELPGCMAQGATMEEAQSNIQEAAIEYILSLLEDGLPIPGPSLTTVGEQITCNTYQDSSTSAQPEDRRQIAKISWVSVPS